MSTGYRNFTKGVSLIPKTGSANSLAGDLEVYPYSGTPRLYFWGVSNDAVTTDNIATTLTNKLLNSSSDFFVDNTNATKKIGFSSSGATASTTLTLAGIQTVNRTITFPDITDTVVTLTASQTLTNKTIVASSNTISGLTNANLSGSAGITNANLATMANNTVKANISGGSAVPSDITAVSTNTPSSFVVRDSSGNFASNVITSSTISTALINTTQTVNSAATGSAVVLSLPTTTTTIFTNSSLTSIQSIAAGATGQFLILKNSTGNSVTITNNAGSAGTKIITGSGIDLTLQNNASVFLEYDSNSSVWTIIGGSGGGGNTTIIKDDYTGDGSTTVYALSATPASILNTNVYISGVYQNKNTYSVTGSTLTFSAAPPNGDLIEILTGVNAVGTTTANVYVDDFTGDSSTTTFTLSTSPSVVNNTSVYFNGVYQNKANYSVFGNQITFSTAPPSGATVEVVTPNTVPIGTPSNGTVTTSSLSTTLLNSLAREHSWELNGLYGSLTFPLTNIDSIFLVPYNINILSVWIYSGTAGSAGTTEFDLKVATTSGGAFSSILSTTGKITSAAASTVWTDSGSVVGSQTGITKPVLSTTAISAGSAIRWDLIQSMTGPQDARIKIFYVQA